MANQDDALEAGYARLAEAHAHEQGERREIRERTLREDQND